MLVRHGAQQSLGTRRGPHAWSHPRQGCRCSASPRPVFYCCFSPVLRALSCSHTRDEHSVPPPQPTSNTHPASRGLKVSLLTPESGSLARTWPSSHHLPRHPGVRANHSSAPGAFAISCWQWSVPLLLLLLYLHLGQLALQLYLFLNLSSINLTGNRLQTTFFFSNVGNNAYSV